MANDQEFDAADAVFEALAWDSPLGIIVGDQVLHPGENQPPDHSLASAKDCLICGQFGLEAVDG